MALRIVRRNPKKKAYVPTPGSINAKRVIKGLPPIIKKGRKTRKTVARKNPARQYYTLVVRDEGIWAPQAGDYSRSVMSEEMIDYKDHGYKTKDLKIIKTGARQADIMIAVGNLNNWLAKK